MVGAADIERLVDQIVAGVGPARVILFGSYAAGTAGDDSDVDVLVVMPYRGVNYREVSRVRMATRVGFPVDIVVRSPAELRRRVALRDFFVLDMVERGIVLYDADDDRVVREGRRRLRRRLHPAAVAKADPV